MIAFGETLDGADEPLFYSILVKGEAIDERAKDVRVKLAPEATSVSVAELTPAFTARYLEPFVPPRQWPEQWKAKAMEEESYSGGGFHVRFRDNRLISIGMCSHCEGVREHPTLGVPNGDAFYSLPLTRQQMLEVFGAPERLYKVGEVRY